MVNIIRWEPEIKPLKELPCDGLFLEITSQRTAVPEAGKPFNLHYSTNSTVRSRFSNVGKATVNPNSRLDVKK